MPMTYTIDPNAHLVRIEGSGRLTDEEMLTCVAALRADPALDPAMNTLSDMRGIEVGFSAEGVRGVVGLMVRTADRRSPAKAAIVADSEVAYGMARMLEMSASDRVDPTFRVFKDLAEATAWLGLAPPTAT